MGRESSTQKLSKVPRLMIDLEDWNKEKLNQLEDYHEMEASLEEKGENVKRKTREEEPKVQRRAKG